MARASLKEKLSRWFLPGFMLISSLTLLIIGVPRFLHELMLVPGTPILERLNSGKKVTEAELDTLERSRLDALDFIELPTAYTDLGASYLFRANKAQMAGATEDSKKFALMAIDASIKGLKMAPLNTFAWARVAAANILLGSDHYGDALGAWRTSVKTARFEPFLLVNRVHLGIILYAEMSSTDIELLKDQFGLAYRWNRGQLRLYAIRNKLTDWMVFLSAPENEETKFFTE